MLEKIKFKNFGPLKSLDWGNLNNINLIIGNNGCGKTFLLKALYSSIRTLEAYKRGAEQRNAAEILADKLYWTFQTQKIGDLVSKGANNSLSFQLYENNKLFCYEYGKDTTRKISSLENHTPARDSHSIFLPAKEVLSLHSIILASREQDALFGFDDTYLDLARALLYLPRQGKNYAHFAQSRKQLKALLDGQIVFDDKNKQWYFKKGRQKFSIGSTAEGIKKIAILDTLLGNRYLSTQSIIFIDELESALHPDAIFKLLDIISLLAKSGIQFFISSHSYFVIKKLYLIAQQQHLSIPIISFQNDTWQSEDLHGGIPDNPIIDDAIALYDQEVDLSLS